MARPVKAAPVEVRRFRARSLAGVEPENVEWLWYGWIPFSKLTLFEGDGKVGKSTITIDIAARVTTGQEFPDEVGEDTREPGNVLFVGMEDGIADTVVPRLRAAGADMGRVFYLTATEDEMFTIPSDVSELRRLIEKHDIWLVVIDPITAFLSDKVDQNGDGGVRRALTRLVEVAAETECALLVIRHFNKKVGQKAQHRGTGSQAFSNLARSVMTAGRDPDNPNCGVLASVVSNIAKTPKSRSYEIMEVTIDGTRELIETTCVEWLGASEHSADAVVGADGHDSRRQAPLREECKDMMREILADGPVPAKEVWKELMDEGGFSKNVIQAAKDELGVESKRVRESGKTSQWLWYPPGTGESIGGF